MIHAGGAHLVDRQGGVVEPAPIFVACVQYFQLRTCVQARLTGTRSASSNFAIGFTRPSTSVSASARSSRDAATSTGAVHRDTIAIARRPDAVGTSCKNHGSIPPGARPGVPRWSATASRRILPTAPSSRIGRANGTVGGPRGRRVGRHIRHRAASRWQHRSRGSSF